MLARVHPVELHDILESRAQYRAAMGCQIVHDSIHVRAGWSREYRLTVRGAPVGHGSVAVGGPWKGIPTVYEYHVEPASRSHGFALFDALLDASGALAIEVQSNDPLGSTMLHAYARQVSSESILFEDAFTTALTVSGASFRAPRPDEVRGDDAAEPGWSGVVELDGRAAARGGILFHYNPPYGDIYMEVDAPYRRRGVGAFLVQELKRVCREGGYLPSARCNPRNVASRRTLVRAGFIPCGHMLRGAVSADRERMSVANQP